MAEYIYETRFEYYITQNGYYKLTHIRNELKNTLKEHRQKISYINDSGNQVSFERNAYSFYLGYIQGESNRKKLQSHNPELKSYDKGLLVVEIRTANPLSIKEKREIETLLYGKSKSKKRKEEVEKQLQNGETVKENRYKVTCKEEKKSIGEYGTIFYIHRSSPMYSKALEMRGAKLENHEEIEQRLQQSIMKRCGERIIVQLKDFNNEKIGYISHYKKGKHNKRNELKNEGQNAKLKVALEKSDYYQKNKGTIKAQGIKNRIEDKLRLTNVNGYYHFQVEFINMSEAVLKQVLLEGLGGKGGLGMGYLHSNSVNEQIDESILLERLQKLSNK